MKGLAKNDGLRRRYAAAALAGRNRFDRRAFIREQTEVYLKAAGKEGGAILPQSLPLGSR